MTPESLIAAPRADLKVDDAAAQVPAAEQPAPTEEQIRNADGIFVDPAENRAVVGLFGAWGGVLLLHDLVAEHLARPAEEEEERPRLDPEPEPPAP
jgi:hypothetical protein